MATRYTSLGTAALIAGSIGASVYTASTAQQAREAISAAHDPTTRHGELAVRVDAGGADVTALAAVTGPTAPGQVLTSDDAGVPTWRDPAAGSSLPDAAGVSDGALLATVGGAQVWAPRIAYTDYDGSSSTGWTLSALDSATAAFSGGLMTFTVPSGVTLATPSRPRATIPLATAGIADPWRVATEAQLVAYDASGLRRAALVISSASSGIDTAAYSSGDIGIVLLIQDSGTIAVWDYVGSTFTAGSPRVTATQTAALDGQDWVRLEQRGPDVRVFYAHGSSHPSSWTMVASCLWGGALGGTTARAPGYVTIGAFRSDSTASVFTVSWDNLRVADLP